MIVEDKDFRSKFSRFLSFQFGNVSMNRHFRESFLCKYLGSIRGSGDPLLMLVEVFYAYYNDVDAYSSCKNRLIGEYGFSDLCLPKE